MKTTIKVLGFILIAHSMTKNEAISNVIDNDIYTKDFSLFFTEKSDKKSDDDSNNESEENSHHPIPFFFPPSLDIEEGIFPNDVLPNAPHTEESLFREFIPEGHFSEEMFSLPNEEFSQKHQQERDENVLVEV